MSVLNKDCPVHGESENANKLRSNLQAVAAEIERHPLFLGKGPFTAEEDENGVVHLKDRAGATRVMMNGNDYQDLLKYKLEHKL